MCIRDSLILLFVGVSLPFLLAAQQKNSVSITKRVLRIPEVTVVGKRPVKDIGAVSYTHLDVYKRQVPGSTARVISVPSIVQAKRASSTFWYVGAIVNS